MEDRVEVRRFELDVADAGVRERARHRALPGDREMRAVRGERGHRAAPADDGAARRRGEHTATGPRRLLRGRHRVPEVEGDDLAPAVGPAEQVLAALVEPSREELERKARGDRGGVRQVEPLVGEASLARELLELR